VPGGVANDIGLGLDDATAGDAFTRTTRSEGRAPSIERLRPNASRTIVIFRATYSDTN
jgi:hypothetical protein